MFDETHAETKAVSESITFWWTVIYKTADVLFKLISWMLLVVALKTISRAADNLTLKVVTFVVTQGYGVVLCACCAFLIAGDFRKFGFDGVRGRKTRMVASMTGLILIILLSLPLFILDDLVAALEAGLKK